jgi:hypothetical protein
MRVHFATKCRFLGFTVTEKQNQTKGLTPSQQSYGLIARELQLHRTSSRSFMSKDGGNPAQARSIWRIGTRGDGRK